MVMLASLFSGSLLAQEKKRVEIIHADELIQKDDLKDAQRLVGHVELMHKGALMFCDSSYVYNTSNNMDAYGNVTINQEIQCYFTRTTCFITGTCARQLQWEMFG